MKQDNPFAKLGALDQKLFEDTATKTQEITDKGEEENATSNKKSESQKVNKSNQKEIVRKSESQQNDLSENQQSDLSENQQFSSQGELSTKTAKRFTTYLTKASLRAIRNIAVDEDRHDYEVFQEAIDSYLTNRKQ
jgi:hypothetical protein